VNSYFLKGTVLLVAIWAAGCVGKIGSWDSAPAVSSAPSPVQAGTPSIAYAMVRLTNLQYTNTLHDLLPGITFTDPVLPNENTVSGFSNLASGQTATALLIEDYQSAAAAIAAAVKNQFGSLVTCTPSNASAETSCAQSFIASFGKNVYRRPPTADESARMLAFFQAQRAGEDFQTAMTDVVQVFLQSPAFIYRLEGSAQAKSGMTPLTSYEVATRLAYFLTNTMPDAQLMAAADADELATADGVETQARRLLADPRAHAAVAQFHHDWLELAKLDGMTKDATAFPKFNATVAGELADGLNQFIEHEFWDQNSLASFLTDSVGYVNNDTATYYGVAAPGSSTAALTPLDSSQRAGILTQPGLLAALADEVDDSPVHRGVLVLNSFLCSPPPPPPPSVNPTPPAATPGVQSTVRQRLEATHVQPSCAVCHATIDNIGFAFENFDATGAWRTTDDGLPVDATAKLSGTDVDGSFTGAVALAQRLAQSQQVASCVAYSWLRYALGLDTSQINLAAAGAIANQFTAAGGAFTELLVDIVRSDYFRSLQVTN
jgi:uncharacterized protein DUF1592/uncharacterized protein DUF1588/uncharacterized protein DUF1595/uncharacterized protein DUF1585/uncharacterized protein DUF1587